MSSELQSAVSQPTRVDVLGLSIAWVTSADLLDEIDRLIARRRPSYVITANLNYAMLTARHADLEAVNRAAALIVADGMPLLWAARRQGTPLPERVAGSDLIFRLAERAADRGHRLFLLGGPPGVAEEAARRLSDRYSKLQVAGTCSPVVRDISGPENGPVIEQIRDAAPHLLLVAFGQPKGERWMHTYCQALGVPVCIQVGASIEFAAGRIQRAPRWMQRTGLEWVYRLLLEPRRLVGRYWSNGLFFLRSMVRPAGVKAVNDH